jgi:hypothetical protein
MQCAPYVKRRRPSSAEYEDDATGLKPLVARSPSFRSAGRRMSIDNVARELEMRRCGLCCGAVSLDTNGAYGLWCLLVQQSKPFTQH